jgi:hypothetical protein
LDLRDRIKTCVHAGKELAEIEERVIEPAGVPQDEKAALWLLAWCELDHRNDRP